MWRFEADLLLDFEMVCPQRFSEVLLVKLVQAVW